MNLEKTSLNFKELDYFVDAVSVPYDTAIKLWKKKFQTYDVFNKEVIIHDVLKPLSKHMFEIWDTIEDISVEEAFKVTNIEVRRLYFQAIGLETIMNTLEPTLLDKQTIDKKTIRFDESNNQYVHSFKDTYELYLIEGSKLFPEETSLYSQQRANLYAVKCKCSTTDREYWIYVESMHCFTNWAQDTPDVIKAIASTLRSPITKPKAVYRQGDVLIFEPSEDSVELGEGTPLRPLSKEDYLNILIFES